MPYDPFAHFVARCESHRHRGRWTVTRLRDGRVMTQTDEPFSAARWLWRWGPDRT